jgi:DNA-binding LacI/PurR family transcriptional regulator
MSALSDVARAAQVSKATASRALSGNGYVSAETRDRVIAAAATLGYVAAGQAANQTRNVGVLIPHFSSWYFGEVLEGIESALVSSGYDLTLHRLDGDRPQRRRVLEHVVVRGRVDAVVAVGIELTPEEVDVLRSLGRPVAGIGGAIPAIPTLGIDDTAAAALATRHLLSLGHRHIVHLGADQAREPDFLVHARRLTGFRHEMDAAGLPADAVAVATATEPTIEGGYRAALSVLADPRSRPTAIMAGCDELAIGAIVAARQLGITVPAQLSVVGIDGHELAPMFGLTTLAQEPRAQGVSAVGIVLRMLHDADRDDSRRDDSGWAPHPVRLDVRSSTTAPPLP